MITIDIAKKEDAREIRVVLEASFPTHTEADLVDAIIASEYYVSELALVARDNDEIVGYSLLSECFLEDERILVLAPVAVKPAWQNRGVGSQLIEAGISKAKRTEYRCISVLGHAEYYPRFGFEKASQYGIKAPFYVPDENFLVYRIADKLSEGTVRYPASFDDV
ncbi:GNAT family N-acetyltransferase [Listeria booriae]|uniref:GNAT family N-acetyltransferase n=1 Tax=Listeria booriae TaxID=1552123 RepID=UPI001625CAC2|nr:N-acetyltransferase [Listeria booriae]MBC1513660.1 N-acetyltransferase [Listeria booriae]MBC6152596.1 N-acetyltransferase [Listeria booriae]MBC6306494.1 N-acetyltransferase [Listeria booriae]